MSIRTNPMKAVPVLLKRVKTTRSILDQRGRDESLDGKLEKLTRELNKIDDLFMKVKKNQDELLDTLTEVDGHLRKLDRKRLDQDMDGICKRITDCAHKLLPMDAIDDSFESEKDHKKRCEIVQSSHGSSSTQYNNQLLLPQHVNLTADMLEDMLEDRLRYCLCSLSIFPEHAVINKRHTINWWIGDGFVETEEVGEDVIDQLLQLNLIVAYGNNGMGADMNKFQIHPHLGRELKLLSEKPNYGWLVLEQQKVIVGDGDPDHKKRTVFNVGASYLNFQSQWLAKQKDLEVLQLGRWQDSPLHHIEVESQEFLKELRNQKHLRFLSLRGISRISELPPSIAQLESLEFLDLKACHNLETLPSDISSMKSLTHLILSQCYLLDGMPKGIDKLTQLQVLKGFVISSSRKTPCKISDLAILKNLKRLSIHIGREAVIKDREFESLGELPALEHLKISWGVSDTRYSDIQIILPSRLKKLHLQGFPGQKIPEWLKPSKLHKEFKELKIMGGKLESMNHDEDKNEWGMEIVRLKYLKYLKVELINLRELFPLLKYAEIKQI